MPSFSCRDVDEVCDWFFREPDIVKLLAVSFEHHDTQHQEVMRGIVERVKGGKINFSDFVEGFRKITRQ